MLHSEPTGRGDSMNYTARQQAARERREALLVQTIGWTTLTTGASLMALAFYTASVIILSN